jgi:hypothetical protein
LVNYRTKQKPLLGDTLNYGLEIPDGSFSFIDSSALVFDVKNRKFGFWKIGEKSIKFSSYDKNVSISSVVRWVNGDILINSYYDYGPYILDLKRGLIKPFESSEKYEWIFREEQGFSSCLHGHLVYIDDKIICIKTIFGRDPDSSLLIVDDIVTDTAEFWVSWMFENYIKFHAGGGVDGGYGRVIKFDKQNLKFDNNFKLWILGESTEFYSENVYSSDPVSYSGQDLVGSRN